jgi:hypothetical protein
MPIPPFSKPFNSNPGETAIISAAQKRRGPGGICSKMRKNAAAEKFRFS